jgi:DNA-binding HxlR family transcriptional regulator
VYTFEKQVCTSFEQVVTSRTYNQQCGIAHALDLVGERWALLVIRELVLGPRRFTDLRAGLPGIATNVLSQRLRQLEQGGIVARRKLPPPAASAVYELTPYGHDLVPILLDLGRWAARSMGPKPPERTMQGRWFAVAMQAFFDSAAAADLHARVAVDFGDAQLTFLFDAGEMDIVQGSDPAADLAVTADPQTLVMYLSGMPVEIEARGDRRLLDRLPQMFPFGAGEPASPTA